MKARFARHRALCVVKTQHFHFHTTNLLCVIKGSFPFFFLLLSFFRKSTNIDGLIQHRNIGLGEDQTTRRNIMPATFKILFLHTNVFLSFTFLFEFSYYVAWLFVHRWKSFDVPASKRVASRTGDFDIQKHFHREITHIMEDILNIISA